MSAWTIAEEETYIVNTLKRYDPKIESLIERCHHARLHETVSQQVRQEYFQYEPFYVAREPG
jgi:hypothetical protein